MPSLLRIALRNVLRNRRRSIMTFAAVFIALSVVVSIRGCVNAMIASVRDSVALGQTGALQIHRKGYLSATGGSSLEFDVPADRAFLDRIAAVPGVDAVTARLSFGAMANANDTSSAAVFLGIDPVHEVRVCPRRSDMISAGRPLLASGPASAILAPALAGALGIHLDERATLLSSDRDGAMNALEVDFVGAYGQPGLPLPDKKLGFVPISLAQDLLRMRGRATEIAIGISQLERAEETKRMIQTAVGPDYEVSTWHDVAPWVDEAVTVYRQILGLLSTVFLVIALLGVVNTMLMAVFERTREIGTMMSLGVRRRQVLGLFLLEASILGLLGGMLGSLAGCSLVLWLAHRGVRIQIGGMSAPMMLFPSITPYEVVVTLGLATAGAALAALWPALRASRLRPVQALASF